MVVLRYKRSRLVMGAVGMLALGGFLSLIGSVIWLVVAVILLGIAVRMLYLVTTDLVAVRCEEHGLQVIKTESTRTIPWDHYHGAEIKELTSYVLGFIPVSRTRILVFKSKAANGWFTRKHQIGLAMLDVALEDLPASLAAIDRFAAGRVGTSVAPEPEALPRGWQTLAMNGIAAAAPNRDGRSPRQLAVQPAASGSYNSGPSTARPLVRSAPRSGVPQTSASTFGKRR